jgi:hypothetical protein
MCATVIHQKVQRISRPSALNTRLRPVQADSRHLHISTFTKLVLGISSARVISLKEAEVVGADFDVAKGEGERVAHPLVSIVALGQDCEGQIKGRDRTGDGE